MNKVQKAKRTVRTEVRTAARKARRAGDTSGNFSKKETQRTIRQVISDVKATPGKVRLAGEFKHPIAQYNGLADLRETKKALRIIHRKAN